jgi:DNA-directed RNA polymerase I, II, and III subunit RPABC5
MIIPIRCMNCGKLIADKWRKYQELVKTANKNESIQQLPSDGNVLMKTPEGEALTALGITRSCCRKHFITHRDLMDKI